jgi:AcrR family transcriptional regulator
MSRSDDRSDHRAKARAATLDAVERIAGLDGVGGLSLKRVADEAGVSTMIVYSHFGDRYGLEEAVVDRAFESLRDAFAGSSTTQGISLESLARAMRTWAHERPVLFSVVFLTGGQLDPTLTPEVGRRLRDLSLEYDTDLEFVGLGLPVTLPALAAAAGLINSEMRGLLGDASAAIFELYCAGVAAAVARAQAGAGW